MPDRETANLALKRMLELFRKNPSLKKLEFQNQKKNMKFVQKENFEPKIKPMIENLRDELYKWENKQGKGAKLCAKIRQELKGKKGSKTFFRVLEFPGKIPNIKKISSEHSNLCEAEISSDEIIKFRWN